MNTKIYVGPYEYHGEPGRVFTSHEHGRHLGDVRIIKKQLFTAFSIYPRFMRQPEVHWVFADDSLNSIEHLREFKASLTKSE